MCLPDCSESQPRLLINIVTLCNTQTNTQKDTRITRRVVLYSQTNTLSKSLAYGRYAHIVITSRRVVRIGAASAGAQSTIVRHPATPSPLARSSPAATLLKEPAVL